jgi:uncharacterized protein DUF3465
MQGLIGKLLVPAAALVALYYGIRNDTPARAAAADVSAPAQRTSPRQTPASGSQIRGTGEVVRVLADDNDGSRHQRFILRLPSGQTLLVAHNIDVAERIAGLRVGDRVEFSGEYEPNPQGGVVHWTHRDPAGRRAGGWLKHGGREYR